MCISPKRFQAGQTNLYHFYYRTPTLLGFTYLNKNTAAAAEHGDIKKPGSFVHNKQSIHYGRKTASADMWWVGGWLVGCVRVIGQDDDEKNDARQFILPKSNLKHMVILKK